MVSLEIKQIDRIFYESNLKSFLPDKIVDFHTHVWQSEFNIDINHSRIATWPERVASENPIEDLLATYKLLFPDKTVTPLIFAMPDTDIERGNKYISQCSKTMNIPSLLLSKPQWTAEYFEQKMLNGNFIGAKVYLSYANDYIPTSEIRIFDYLPPHQLEILDQLKKIVILHIPREKRLRDPVNLAQMLEIEKHFPNIKLVIAHVGRAYCREDVGDAFNVLAGTQNMMFDISANTNSWIFDKLIKAVGSKRIIFGSDLPITRMRMRRITKGDTYVNLVPKGLYGNISNEKNLWEVTGAEAENLSFFLYEEIEAFRQAAIATCLSESEIEDIFWGNAQKLFSESK